MNAKWRTRINEKKRRSSSTPGCTKAGCKPHHSDKAMAKRSRSYKDPDYQAWCDKIDIRNNMKRERNK